MLVSEHKQQLLFKWGREGEINPKPDYSQVGSFGVGVCVHACMCSHFICVFSKCEAAALYRQQGKDLSQLLTGPPYMRTHKHTQAGFGDELLIHVGRHHASANAVISRDAVASSL